MEIEKEYKVGDEVWYVIGNGLAIKCKITEIDYSFRNKSPSGYLFYSVDEPLGHDLCYYDFFDTKEEAVEALREDKADRRTPYYTDINAWRATNKAFIIKTHVSSSTTEEIQGLENNPCWNYPVKEKGVDYLTYDDV